MHRPNTARAGSLEGKTERGREREGDDGGGSETQGYIPLCAVDPPAESHLANAPGAMTCSRMNSLDLNSFLLLATATLPPLTSLPFYLSTLVPPSPRVSPLFVPGLVRALSF